MQKSKFLLIVILGLLTALGPLATDIYLPAFEDIAETFKNPISYISYSLSSFFIGLAIGQVIYGPLLERFGRKLPVYIGIGVYISASVGCAMAASVNTLILFRFFQALGACAGMVSSRAVVRDLFEGKEVARVFSLLMAVLAVSPVLAPTLGGIISANYSWRYVFIVMTFVALVVLIGFIFFLPESRSPDKNYSLKLDSIFSNYVTVFKDTYFTLYAIAGSMAYAGIYAYISGSPHLYLELFDVTQTQYSVIFAVIASGLIGATQLSNLFLRWTSSEKLVNTGLMAQCVFAIVLLICHFVDLENVIFTTILITCYMVCLGFIFPNASALAMSRLRHTAGSASALLGSVQMIMGALASALVSYLRISGSLSMLLVMGGCALIAQLLLGVNERMIH